jgi:hypothetical protein
MRMNRSKSGRNISLISAFALLFGMAPEGAAQRGPSASAALAVRSGSSSREVRSAPVRSEALAKGRYAVVIDLDHNELHFRQGEHTLWSAPIGTGTGLRMKDDDQAWDFSTPDGVFHVKFKERDPVWIAEDWYFVENGLPVPPPNDPKRYFPGGLGAAAVYIDHDLAIHGTDKPELLGQRVSHGCIRLSNKDALRLYHNVQVGTEVVIIGGENIEREEITPAEAQRLAAAFKPAAKKAPPKDPLLDSWKKMSTSDLLLVLDSELWEDSGRTRWTEVAHLLSDRGLDGDRRAMTGLLRAALDLPDMAVEREYRTYLADAFARGGTETVEVLARFDPAERERIAAMIVDASLDLFHGDLAGASAPWPTRRVPQAAVNAAGRSGWTALREAEESYASRARRRST